MAKIKNIAYVHQIIHGRSQGAYSSPGITVSPGSKLKIKDKLTLYYEFGKDTAACKRETLISECYFNRSVKKYYIRDSDRNILVPDDTFYRSYLADYRTSK